MDALRTFLDQAFTMPTTVWSVLLVLVGGYWLLSLLTGADIEALDGVDGAMDGGLDHVLDGGVEHALDGGLDHVLDGGVDHVLDGGVEHALHGALDGGLDHALDSLDGHEAISGPRSHGLLGWLGFHDVPKTFSLTLVVGFGWLVSYFGTAWLVDAGKWAAFGVGTAFILGLASLTVAIGMTAVAIIPLRRLLVLRVGAENIDFLGETCIVRTGRVDEAFGQAETRGGQLVQVRARDGRAYRHGESAVIFDYDREKEVFYIAPLDALGDSVPSSDSARSTE
ncbi:MAG: hypothetical protein MPN21_21210 [Thermoanaerobaculia bacterium]|nr:hypothetical protein [Thermoanaerobaculia bacterium]